MIRTFLLCVLFITAVSANDIYVTQSQTNTQETTQKNDAGGFTEPQTVHEEEITFQQPQGGSNFEKSLIVPTDSAQYCSVVAGCLDIE